MKSTYNNNILSIIENYLSGILRRTSERDKLGRLLELEPIMPIDSGDQQVSDLISDRATGMFKLLINVKVTDKDGTVSNISDTIEVPKMINDIFIIEGKYRISTNILTNNNICRIESSKRNRIYFDYNTIVSWSPNKIGKYSQDDTIVTTHDADYNKLKFQGTEENYNEYKEFLKLTLEQKQVIQVKLDIDKCPDYIDGDLVGKLFSLGDDRLYDRSVDKSVSTIESDFKSYLNLRENKRSVFTTVSNKWWSLGGLYLSDLQNKIRGYFKVARSQCIEIPKNVNPLVYDALRYKVVISKSVSFNKSMSDIMDPADTPENNNGNRINELNVCAPIEDGTIYYLPYEIKTGEKVKMTYLEYLNHKVLKCEYYDYRRSRIIESNEYVYYYHSKDIKVESLDGLDIEYVEPKPDEKLSSVTRKIPLINMSDAVRIFMGSSMARQSIEIEGSEPRMVSTGNDSEDSKASTNIVRYDRQVPGTIMEISNNIVIMGDDGIITTVKVPSPSVGSNDSLTTYECLVKVGDKVDSGMKLIAPKILVHDNYELGLNAKAIYMNYLGYTYEDGVVISESYANRCRSYALIRTTSFIVDGDIAKYIIPIGSHIKSGDKLVVKDSRLRVKSGILKSLQNDKDAFNIIDLKYEHNNSIVPNNIEDGYITDVKISFNPEFESKNLSEVTKNTLNNYDSQKKSPDLLKLPKKYRSMESSSPDTFTPKQFAAITFTIIKVNPMKIGDKSCNSYGSKGIVSLVLPDELMPRIGTDDNGNGGTPAEIIMNPAAVASRKNVSQLYELNLNNCIDAIYKKVGDLLSDGKISEAKEFTEEFYDDKFSTLTDTEFLNSYNLGINNFQMEVGSYSRIKYETIMKWMKDLGVKEGEQAFLPDLVIYESANGTKACSPEEADKLGIKGKYHELGFTDQNVVFGKSYMYKLYHAADYTGTVTSDMVSPDGPRLHRGKYKDEGQKIGEMELWSLMSNGASAFLTRDTGNLRTGENTFLQELMISGFVLVDAVGIPYGSEYRNKMKELKDKYDE